MIFLSVEDSCSAAFFKRYSIRYCTGVLRRYFLKSLVQLLLQIAPTEEIFSRVKCLA